MSFFRYLVVGTVLLGLTSCTLPEKPANYDTEGMQSLLVRDAPITIKYWMPPGHNDQRFTVQDTETGQMKARLVVGLDGKVKKATYLEGIKKIWMEWSRPLRLFEFAISPNAIPGPWEVDVLILVEARQLGIGGEPLKRPIYSAAPQSYRTAVQ